jgi:hypothetical protein
VPVRVAECGEKQETGHREPSAVEACAVPGSKSGR